MQPVFAAFAVIAMVMHAIFWVSCALQFPPGTVKVAGDAFLIPICTPDGIQLTRMDAGETGEGGDITQNCPTCALVCGLDHPATASADAGPVGWTAALPPAAIEAGQRARLLARTAVIPRAPPAVFSTI